MASQRGSQLADQLYRGSYGSAKFGDLPTPEDFSYARRRLQDDYDYNVSLRQTGIINSSVERGIEYAQALLNGRSAYLDKKQKEVEDELRIRKNKKIAESAKVAADAVKKVTNVLQDQAKGLPISQEAKLTAGIIKSSTRKPLPKLRKRRR